MSEIEKELVEALITLSIDESNFRKCEEAIAQNIVTKARKIFVEGNPRCWWLSLKTPYKVFDYAPTRGVEHLLDHIPNNKSSCWFIPETEKQNLPVFDVQTVYIPAILRECSFFEFYLVGKSFNWLLIDSDHNQILIADILPDSNFTE